MGRLRLLVIGLVDVVVAAAVAWVAMLSFATWGCDDVNPPVCSNYWGRTVPDGRSPGTVLMVTSSSC